MERSAVASNNIAEVGYDSDMQTLEILFRSGGLYQYYNVPALLHEQLIRAPSVGAFFNAEIKGHFPESRL